MSFGDGDFHQQSIVTLATKMQTPRILPCFPSSWIYRHATKLTNNKKLQNTKRTDHVLLACAGNRRSDVPPGADLKNELTWATIYTISFTKVLNII